MRARSTTLRKPQGPRGESRMLKLAPKDDAQSSRFSDSQPLATDWAPRYQIGQEDADLLKEVLETLEQDESSTEDGPRQSHQVYNRWLVTFQNQESNFSSVVVVCEMKYHELKQITASFKVPNIIQTAGCCVLLEELCSASNSRQANLLSTIKDNLMASIYRDYEVNEFPSKEKTDFLRKVPFFSNEWQKKYEALEAELKHIHHQQTVAKNFFQVRDRWLGRKVFFFESFVKKTYFSLWKAVIEEKHAIIERLRHRAEVLKAFRGLGFFFLIWKTQGLQELIWKQAEEFRTLELQLEYIVTKNPEVGKEALEYAQSVLSTESDQRSAEQDDDFIASAVLSKTAARDSTIAACLQVIAEVYNEKMIADKECDKMGAPRLNLPDICKTYFLKQSSSRSPAMHKMNDFFLSIQKWREQHLRVQTFGYLVNAFGDLDWDPHAAGFVIDALCLAVPPSLLLERLSAVTPCLSLGDAIKATERLSESQYSFQPLSGDLVINVSKISGSGLQESDLNGTNVVHPPDKILLDAWVDVVVQDWRSRLQSCKTQTIRLIETRQRDLSKTDKVFNLIRFSGMMREVDPEMTDFQILHIYKEVTDLSSSRNLDDSIQALAFFEVCRRHNISYIGPK